jgi:signal transduction histidine kinase
VALYASAVVLLQGVLLIMWIVYVAENVREFIARSQLDAIQEYAGLDSCDAAPETWQAPIRDPQIFALGPNGRALNPAAPDFQVDMAGLDPSGWTPFVHRFKASVLTLDRDGPCRHFLILRPALADSLSSSRAAMIGWRLAIDVLIVSLLVLGIAVPLVRRVRKMAREGQRVVESDFRGTVPMGDDELGELGAQFNHACATARARLEELHRREGVLTQTLADLAHDIRTPLGSLKLGLSSPRGPALGELDALRAEVQYLEGLFANLCSLSQIESSELRLMRTDVDLAQIASNVALRFQIISDGARVALEVSLPKEPAMVDADPIALEQAVGNLVENAIRFAQSSVVISVYAQGREAAAEVLDDGPGIEEALLPNLVQRWRRGGSGERREVHPGRRGLGLGLAISQAIVDAHHGRLELQRADGGGTLARITLPLAASARSSGG